MSKLLNLDDSKKYFQSQMDICVNCELFSDKNEHGSKIIMLFAEIFSFIVNIYGLSNTSSVITQYSNTVGFKKWFWHIKHTLGEQLQGDPSFDDIGKWIGKGFFLKICLSLIIYNGLVIEETILNKIINKQKKIIKELAKEKYFTNGEKCIEEKNDCCFLLNEKIILSHNNEHFYLENIII